MRARIPAAILLSVLVAAAVQSQTPTGQPDPKDPKGGSTTKLPEPKWPSEIGGKNVDAWLKDVIDPDPAVREYALRTLPGFGPDIRSKASKLLLSRMAFAGEKDPGVRITLFNTAATIGFEKEVDMHEAARILALTVENGQPGGLSRLHAVQTLALLGPKATESTTSGVIGALTGVALQDTSYETRRSIAGTLGRVGMNETTGPNLKALGALAGTLAKDVSAAVRMEALQSLVVLGPPWDGPKKAGGPLPGIDTKGAKIVTDAMRVRIGDGKMKGLETDKQLEIWCRVVLMRFDEKEITNENLAAISRYTTAPEMGPKLQALQALALFGENAAKRIDDVVKVLDEDDSLVITTSLSAFGAMGEKGKPALPYLEKAEKKWEKLRQDKLKDPDVVKFIATLKEEDRPRFISSLQEEQTRLAILETIKWIKDSKPGMPGGERPMTTGGMEPKKP